MEDRELLAQVNESARRIFQMEAERDREVALVNAKYGEAIEAENQRQLALIRRLRAGTTGSVVDGSTGQSASSPSKSFDELMGPLSVRMKIVLYITHHEPVSQETVISALAAYGISESTAKQAIYDLTSTKVGWLDRTEKGLLVNEEGRSALRRVLEVA